MTKKLIFLILVIFCSSIILVNKKPQTKFIAANEESSFIAAYIDGEISKTLPSKNDGYTVEKVVCDNDAVGKWDDNKWGLLTTNLTKRTKCNIYFKKITAHEFNYTGSEQVFTAEATGIYKLETWGAQGDSSSGGYGAYSVGTVNLNKGDKLYIYVGSPATSNMISGAISGNIFLGTSGGYNGGGNGYYSGGGATHIATTSGLLSTLSSKKDKILIVSGGGGGASKTGAGGSAGGIQGVRGVTGACTDKGGYGGTQTAGGATAANNGWGEAGSFGKGGNYKDASSSSSSSSSVVKGGGGGSGFYGGASGDSGACYGGGGGGSSYIGNSLLSDKAMYCYNCTTSNDTNTKTISTTCNEENPTENCAKKGNGYAKITLQHMVEYEYYVNNEKVNDVPDKTYYDFVSASCANGSSVTWDTTGWNAVISQVKSSDTCKFNFKDKTTYTFNYTGSEQIFTVNAAGTYKLETWGAQGNSDTGAYGAYSVGTISLNKGDKLYINVGGTTTSGAGGYNGGGTGNHGGGGATHIAKASGLLSTLSSNVSNILIVSGGGGGAGQDGAGGSAGGFEGKKGGEGNSYDKGGRGGTQSSGGSVTDTNWAQVGSFGKGGNSLQNQTGGAGGGGYFGGGAGTSGTNYGGGGGGSGYIGNSLLSNKAMYCYNCATSNDTNTKTISTTCNEATPTENCAKKGNGYAKVTFKSEN